MLYRMFQNFTNKIEGGVLHNKSSKNVQLCVQKCFIWAWSSAWCNQPSVCICLAICPERPPAAIMFADIAMLST
jgi:hypothetical protein